MSDQAKKLGAWARFKALSVDSTPKTLLVAIGLCLFCSMIVSGAAVYLKPVQEANKLLDKKKNVLQVAGLYSPDVDINEAFANIEIKIVDLKTGLYTDAVDAQTYDQKTAAKDPAMSILLKNDPASIKRQAKYASIYIVPTADGQIDKIILPIHGYGLWSTLYGFIAIKGDGNEIAGLQFYEQGETPGLGAEVDNPIWKAKWPGQKVYGDDGTVQITVSKSPKPTGEAGKYHVDALAGATLTSRGVDNLVKFWMGEQGFKLFLDNLKNGSL